MAKRRGHRAKRRLEVDGRNREDRPAVLPGLERSPGAAVQANAETATALAEPEPERAPRRPAAAEVPGSEFLCPACDSADFRVLFNATDRLYRATERSFRVVECSACRLIRIYPRPATTELHRFYPENYWYAPEASAADRLEQAYRRLVLGDHVSFVRRSLERTCESGPVLDVGCGGGLFLRMLRDEGAPVVGIDFSAEAAGVAWHSNGVPALCADLEDAPLAPHSCAAVTMFHVLEHLPSPDRYLNAAAALLRPEGRLFVQVPNAACWQFPLLGENWSGLDVPRHLVNFKPKDLDWLLDCCGFEVLRHKYFSLRDNPAGFATSLAPALDPLVRKIRGATQSPRERMFHDLLYFSLVLAALPFALLEAACRAGSTVMVEARRKP